jgi:hypothetical protein
MLNNRGRVGVLLGRGAKSSFKKRSSQFMTYSRMKMLRRGTRRSYRRAWGDSTKKLSWLNKKKRRTGGLNHYKLFVIQLAIGGLRQSVRVIRG